MLKRIFRRLYEIAEIMVILGAINWGSIGIFRVDLITKINFKVIEIFGLSEAAYIFRPMGVASRVFYTLIALSALWVIFAMIKSRSVSNPSEAPVPHHPRKKN